MHYFKEFARLDIHTMELDMRPSQMIVSQKNTEIVDFLPKIDYKIRQHLVAYAIMLMLHHLNQRKSAGIFF